MRIIVISLILLTLLNCNPKKGIDKEAAWLFYILVIVPDRQKKEQCSKPNAIAPPYVRGLGGTNFCISDKVSNGLIFDANTSAMITSETLPPGQSFLCQCGTTYNRNGWYRGNKVEDNPQPGIAISSIFTTSPSESTTNKALVYKTNYNQSDNLYCITLCPVDASNVSYQLLKIR